MLIGGAVIDGIVHYVTTNRVLSGNGPATHCPIFAIL